RTGGTCRVGRACPRWHLGWPAWALGLVAGQGANAGGAAQLRDEVPARLAPVLLAAPAVGERERQANRGQALRLATGVAGRDTLMHVIVDGIVYGRQRFGGINTYFNEVLPRLARQPDTRVDLLMPRRH